jgi:hypothetical protein
MAPARWCTIPAGVHMMFSTQDLIAGHSFFRTKALERDDPTRPHKPTHRLRGVRAHHVPWPGRWRGPRLRNHVKRPSRLPIRYRVYFERVMP